MGHEGEIAVQSGADALPMANVQPKLDHSKLLGFRNVLAVTKPDSDLVESSDLAFHKRGVAEAA